MKVYSDIENHKPKIISSIRKFGFSPEHNYYHYLYKQRTYKKGVFFDFGQNKGVMSLYNEKSSIWHVPAEVLAPIEERLEIFLKALEHMLASKKAKKVVAEFGEGFASKVFRQLAGSKYKTNVNYKLYWPVYEMAELDEELNGKKWKKLRNIRNRFSKQLNPSVLNPQEIDKNALRGIFFSWLKRRNSNDWVDRHYYLNIIDNGFTGFDMARAMLINNEPCSFSAGWGIPNSNSFYCGIGIFNYNYKDMGDFLNLSDLLHIKKKNYSSADLGGSDKALLFSKSKFKPKRIYKTYVFSVARKK